MSTEQTPLPDSVTAEVKLGGPEWQLETTVTVPAGPMRLRQMLPLVQALADRVGEVAAGQVEETGERISCKKGCGACCRQMVPIAEVEARALRDLVEAMPEPRRTEIRTRFGAALRKIEEAGLLQKLRHREDWADGDGRTVGLRYFSLGIPCPFLEDESCSIHAGRPVACREYLVTSPAENCARPSAETVKMVPMPLKVWTALARFDEVPPQSRTIRWLPLILAHDWSEQAPPEPPPRSGPDLLRQLFEHLKGSSREISRA